MHGNMNVMAPLLFRKNNKILLIFLYSSIFYMLGQILYKL